MIVKNEEENIKECLDRALEVVDEAIIVDTGSTDNTRELLREYEKRNNVHVIDYVWENDFSKARNKSLENAKGDYILILDADERIFCKRDKLDAFLLESNGVAYNIPIYNVFGNKEIIVTSEMIRLYRNNNPFYTGAIHEQLAINGEIYHGEIIDGEICKIYHFGYSHKVYQSKNKMKRNVDIINAEIEKNPDDPFNWYNKGVMDMTAEKYDDAIDHFIKAHKLCRGVRKAFHNDLLVRMMQCMMFQKKYKQAVDFINILTDDPYINTLPDIYYYLGISYAKLKRYREAVENFKKAIEIGDVTQGISELGAGSYLPMLEWARVLRKTGEIENSIVKYKEAVFHYNNINHKGFDELQHLLLKKNRLEELEELKEKVLKKNIQAGKSEMDKKAFEKYKEEFKKNIQSLIEKGLVNESRKLIDEYEKIVENDIDIICMKGIISMIEQDMQSAQKFFEAGLKIDRNHFDLLFNMGYLYQTVGQNELSEKYYREALKNAGSEKDVSDVNEALQALN